jgi:hypothetical protein
MIVAIKRGAKSPVGVSHVLKWSWQGAKWPTQALARRIAEIYGCDPSKASWQAHNQIFRVLIRGEEIFKRSYTRSGDVNILREDA